MTRIGDRGDAPIDLNPDVPFPPFPLWLRVPADWSKLDTNPATWSRSAGDLVDNSFNGSRLPAKDRRAALAVVEDLVVDCQRAGTALSLLTMGRSEVGDIASFGIHLAFGSDGRPASLGRVHDTLPRSGTVVEVASAAGPAVMHRDRMTMMVPGTTTMKALTSIQFWLPIPETSWTVILSTASAFPELTGELEQVLRTMGTSIRLSEDPTEPAAADSDDHSDAGGESVDGEFEPAPPMCGPGIERGFGTFLVRRIRGSPEIPDPETPNSEVAHHKPSATDQQVPPHEPES